MTKNRESGSSTTTSYESISTEDMIRFMCLLEIAQTQHNNETLGKGAMSVYALKKDIETTLGSVNHELQKKAPTEDTLRDWIKKAANNRFDELARTKGEKLKVFGDYLRLRHQWKVSEVAKKLEFERINRTSSHGELAYQMARTFSADTGGYGYAALGNFAGEFVCYRRAWASGYADHFQRSLIKISFKDSWTIMEVQKISLGGHAVDEINEGPILPFGSNFFATLSTKSVFKFLGISGFYPEPGTDKTVQLFFGHGQGISGKGPHPGYPYVCSRIDGCMKIGDPGKDVSEYAHLRETLVLHESAWDRIPTTTDRALLEEGQEIPSDLPISIRDDRHAEQSLRLLRRLEQAKLTDRM